MVTEETEMKKKGICATFTNLIHNTQGLRYVQVDSVGKLSPSVVQCLYSTSEAQNGHIWEKKDVFASTN